MENENGLIEEKKIFYSIFTNLMNNNLENVSNDLKTYLKIIKKENYESFINNLINTCTVDKDNLYLKTLIVLTIMSLGNYTFDISSYIQKLSNVQSENETEVVLTYLNTILENNKLSSDKIKAYGIDKSLEYFNEKNRKIEELEKYLMPICEKLSEKNVMILLDPMNDNQINNTLQFIKKYANIQAKVINYEGEKRIYLKYHVNMDDSKKEELYNEFGKCVKERNYSIIISKGQEFLSSYSILNSLPYFYIADSYYELGQYSNAIDYFRVSVALAKEDKRLNEFWIGYCKRLIRDCSSICLEGDNIYHRIEIKERNNIMSLVEDIRKILAIPEKKSKILKKRAN